jgi:hypothetical protein
VVVFFHQEGEGTPGAPIEVVGRFFRSDAPDTPVLPDGSDSLCGWRMWRARWRDVGDPLQYVAHAALAFPTTRLQRNALSPPREWMFDPRRRRVSHAHLRNEMIVLMWQLCTGEQAGLPYCESQSVILSEPVPTGDSGTSPGRRQGVHALRCMMNSLSEPIAYGACFRVGSGPRSDNSLIPGGMPGALDIGI